MPYGDSGLCVPEKRPPFEGSTTVCRRGLGPARQTASQVQGVAKTKTDLETAKALRERQLKDGHQQLAILGKMRSLAGKGRDRFRSAQLAAKVAEKEAQEQDLLQKKAESLDAAAESYVQKDREDVETRFRIPLFNVRLKLGSIKMSEASQNALLQEEQELLDKRREAIEAIEEKKAAWIKEQMASDISESRARMDAFQQSLTVDLVKEETGLDLTKKNSNLDKKSLIRSLLPWILRSSVRTRRRRNCVRKSTVISSAPSRKPILPGSTPWFSESAGQYIGR